MTDRPHTAIVIPDPPRVVPSRLYLRRARCMFFLGISFLAMSPAGVLIMLIVHSSIGGGLTAPLPDLLLNANHSIATGTVTSKKLITAVHMNSEHPWRIGFHYDLPGGASVAGSGFTYDQDLGNRIQPGDQIEIEYDPSNPTRARPAGGYVGSAPPWVQLLLHGMFGSIGVIGAGLLIATYMTERRDRKLLTYGIAAEGTVVRVRCIGTINFGTKHPYDVYYQFRDPWGREITGRDRTYSYAWAEGLQPGERVGVVFNPRDPHENALWLHGKELERLGGIDPALLRPGIHSGRTG